MKGFMDGTHFKDWYFEDQVSKSDYEVTSVVRWMEIPD